jgi:hypothetical protein
MKKFELFQGESTDIDGGNRYHITDFEAKDLDEAIEYVKKEWINKDIVDQIQEDYDGVGVYMSYMYHTDEQGNEVDLNKVDFDELKHTTVTEYFEIMEIEA